MRVTGETIEQFAVTLEKVGIPRGEVAYIRQYAIRPYGIVRDNKRGLYYEDKIQLRVRFYDFPHGHGFQFVVVSKPVPLAIVVKEFCFLFVITPTGFLFIHPFPNGGEVIYRSVVYGALQLVFEVYPREIRELQIVFEYFLERLIAEHYLLR